MEGVFINMRKAIKKNIMGVIQTLYEMHAYIKEYIDKGDKQNVFLLLEDCQQAAIQIGTAIEEAEGDGHVAIKYLEQYCEKVYEISVDDYVSGGKAKKSLDKSLILSENIIKSDVKVRLEVVFMPYKASMWDSMESIWKEMIKDVDFDIYVVPIPYYDRNPDGTFGTLHYEGDDYPKYVRVIDYTQYDFQERCPDIVFIHNPYDEYNYVTSVEPRFYSKELKKYTECLVYVPYFLVPKMPISQELISTSVLFYADYVIAQNEQVRQAYIKEIKEIELLKPNKNYEVLALGSPKTDKIHDICKNGIDIPDEWKQKAGTKKKLFINTNVSLILNNNEKFVENMSRVFEILKRRNDVFVIWREHPLTNEALKSMRPELLEEYNQLKKDFIKSNIGVLDTNVEAFEAMCFSDCYFGAGGSLLPLYAVTGKPMLVTAYKYPDSMSNRMASAAMLLKYAENHIYYYEKFVNLLDVFLDNLENLMEYREKRFEILETITANINGSVGKKIVETLKEKQSI